MSSISSNKHIIRSDVSCAASSTSLSTDVESEFVLPSLKYLLDLPQKLFTIQHASSGSTSSSSIVRRERNQSSPSVVNNASKWLLMAASGLIEEVSVGRRQVVTANFISGCCNILLHTLEASPAVRDDRGFSVIHWLVFDGLRQAVVSTASNDSSTFTAEYGVPFRRKEPHEIWAMECGGSKPDEKELAEPHLGDLWRYRCETALLMLLEKSEELGFRGSLTSTIEDDQYYAKSSILDIADYKYGNTPLHYAVAFKRVDIVGLLLRHGASIKVKNAAGVAPFDLLEFDQHDTTMTIPKHDDSSATSTLDKPPDDRSVDCKQGTGISIYSSLTSIVERRWGIPDHLRIDQCSYYGESNGAAIKRLLFQRELNLAVNHGDDGDLPQVQRLVDYWMKQQSDGKKMYPLVYRADVDLMSPLQTASAYVSNEVSILKQLLRLPHTFHVQSDFHFPAVTVAAISNNLAATLMLQQAGFDINCRDIAVGKTCLHAVAEMLLIRDSDQMEDEEASAVTEAYICDYMRRLIASGANPSIVDNIGNSPLHIAAHRGLIGVTHLMLGWNDTNMRSSSSTSADFNLSLIDQSMFILQQNLYGNTPLHYAFYSAHESDSHAACLSLFLSLGIDVNGPKNKQQLSPLQLFVGYDTDRGKRICKGLLKMTEQHLRNIVKPSRMRVKRNVLVSDLTQGKERFKVPVISEFEVRNDETAVMQLRSDHYLSKNRYKINADPFEKLIEQIDSSITVLEALEDEKKSDGASESKPLRRRVSMAENAFSPDSLREFITSDEDLQETRRLLDRGLGFPLEIRLTEMKGFALFTTAAIPKGAFVCEFVGEFLNFIQANRREREYRQSGGNSTQHQISGLYNLNRDAYVIDQFEYSNVSYFISHSCEPNLVCLRVLENTRVGIYALRNITANSELTLNYAFEKGRTQETVICHCDSKDCQRTLM